MGFSSLVCRAQIEKLPGHQFPDDFPLVVSTLSLFSGEKKVSTKYVLVLFAEIDYQADRNYTDRLLSEVFLLLF
jgi:hypothetical protein